MHQMFMNLFSLTCKNVGRCTIQYFNICLRVKIFNASISQWKRKYNICSGEFHESKLKLRINTLLMKNKDDLPLQIS